MKNNSFRLTVVIAMFVNLVGPALAPLPAAAAPARASLSALPSWFAPASAATSEPEAALPSWFASDNRRPAAAIEHPASGALPAWFSPPTRPTNQSHHTIYPNNVTVSGPTDINNCDIVTYTIVAANNSFTTTNVIITSTMPGDFTPLSLETCSYSTVTPNETITCTVTYQAGCDAVSGQNVVTLTQSEHSPIVQRTEFTVLPGAITLRKVPSVIPASVGDVVTWTVIVENTGYGRVDNVVVTDTLGTGLDFVSGALSASTASLAVGDFLTFTVSARVTECTGLDNDVEAAWGCSGQTCQTHTAQASIDLQLDAPYLDYQLPDFDIDYCVGSGTFNIPVNNSGLGTAHNVVLSMTNTNPFSITALSDGASYSPDVGFTLPDITGTSGYSLVCELAADSPCALSPSGGNFEFELKFDDDCGNPYVLPVKQKNWSLSGDVPSLSISKEMPDEIYLGEAVTPTITVEAANVVYSPVVVTDTLPPDWTVVDSRGGNVFTITGQVYITWTVPGDATTVLTPVIRSPIISGTGICVYCGSVAQNHVEVRATDCQTCTHYAQDTATTQIQCEDILNSHGKQVAPAAAETCTGFVYTSTYIFASFDVTPTWAGMVFTDDLPYQTYVTGSASIQLSNGPTNCGAVFSETVSNGRLVITNISPTCSISVPNTTMEIVFQSAITAPGGCADMTFYDWSRLNLGVTGNGICADDGILEEGVYVSVDAPQMALGIDGIPANVEPCAAYTITLTLTRLGDAPAKDVALRFDTVDYAIVELLGFGGLTPYFTHTGAFSRTWFYSDDFTTATTATVYLRIQRHCDATSGALAHAWYEGNCEDDDEYFEECYINNGANPPALWPSLIVAKYPELYYADDDVVTWTLTLINSGPATARDVILTDTLGAGLRYYTSTITTTRGSVAGVIPEISPDERLITWTLHEVASGAQVTIKFVAEIVSCEDLTNDFSGWQSCLDETCLHEGPKSSYVLLPDTVLINTNNALSPLYTCLTRTITATVKNAGLMSVYSATVTEALPDGMLYVTGSTRYVVSTGATPPPTGWIAGGEPANGPLGPLMWRSDQITNLARLYPHETVWIVFDVRAGCEFEGGNITIQASYRDVCGNPQSSSASHFAMTAEPPEVTARKVGRNLATGSDWGNPTVAEPGDTIQWRITVDNSGGSDAPDTVVTDTLPSNTTFVTATLPHTLQSGTVVWDIGTLTAHTSRVFTVTATVNVSECAEIDTTNTVTAVWGCPDPVCLREVVGTATLRTRPVFDEFSLTTSLPPATLHRCGGPITITLTNNGSPAYDVVLTDTLPTGFTYSGIIYASTSPSSTTGLGDTVVYTWGVLPTGITTIAFRVDSGGSGDCTEPSGGNNVINLSYDDASSCLATGPYTAVDSTAIAVISPTLEIEKTPVSQVADVGEVVAWTITVSNTGSGDAPNVVVTDTVGSGFSSWGATNGSDSDETNAPVIVGRIITWTPVVTIAVGDAWQATVTATVTAGGAQTNTVEARGTCAAGCTYAATDDTAYVTLLRGFSKWPDIQTGTVGSLVVFTLTTILPDQDALYQDLTLTDTLPAGLGYVSSWLSATYDIDGNQGGSGNIISATPTITPGWLDSGRVVWRLGDLSGTVSVNGVITAVIQNITANIDGVRLTNVLTMSYSDDGQPYVYTDTADVDVLEPVLHIGKSYVTPQECGATLLQDNFNIPDTTTSPFGSWTHVSDDTEIRDGTLHLSGSGDVQNATVLSDFSLSFIARKNAGSTGDFWAIFRISGDYDDDSYQLTWTDTTLQLYEYNASSGDHDIGSSVSAPDALVWHHFEIRTYGSQLEVYVDGELQISVTDDSHTSGYTQIRTLTGDSDYDVDDILVTRFGETACTVGANDHVTYTIVVSNQARIPGYDLVITDSIPAGMSFYTYTLVSDDPASVATTWPIPGETGNLIWGISRLTATSPFNPLNHTALTLTVVLTVSDAITANIVLPNQASLAYSSQFGPGPVGVEQDYSGGSHSTAVRTVDGFIAKQILLGPPPTATLGEIVTYTIQVPAPPITATLYNVTVTDQLDSRLRIRTVADGPDGTVTRADSAFTVTYPSIPAGQQRFITVTAVLSSPLMASVGDVITNVAVLEHRDGGPTPSEEPPFTVTEPSLTLVKASDPSTSNTVRAGDSVTYTVAIANWSAAYASPAYDVVFTDTLPVGMRDAAPTLITVTLDGAAVPYNSGYNAATGLFTLTFSSAFSIPAGGELEIQYLAAVDSDVAAGQDLTNTAQVSWSSLPGPVDGDRDYGPEEDDTTVHTPPANSLSKGVTPLTIAIGSQVIFSATLPDPPEGVVLHNVIFTDVVDARLSIGGVFVTGGASWGVDGQTVTVTWASIPTYTQRYVYITTTLRHMPTTTMGTQITNVAIFSHDMLTAPVESNVVTTTIIYDWGDLPEGSYPYSTTLGRDGPRHVISPTLYLGSRVDAEGNGQPNAPANGDDSNATAFGAGSLPGDDEDGVVWSTLILGRNSTFTITASADNGYLNGWMDFNADGDFDDAGERVISGALLSTGINTFTVMVPATTTSVTAPVYMRFRYSTQQNLQPDGAAPDGEVEDYVAATLAYDWGDLPDTPYPTTLAQNGARHVISDTFYLGSRVDAEGDGQPNVGADGDDNTNTSGVGNGLPDDDEDGVEWQPLVLGRASIFTITASVDFGYLNGWIDFNADGDLNDAGERVISGTLLNAGVNTFSIPAPTTATITATTYMRFRYSTEPTLQPTGAAPDGEVEDYRAPLTAYDFGDLPEGPYSTTLAQNGARHIITPTNNPTLGDVVDAEGDGQPSANADGDDNTLTPDDEDGVQLDSTLIAGQVTTLTITATNVSGAFLNAWIDFDGDGTFEQIFTNTTLSEGANTLTFTVPMVVLSNTLNARFRYSSDSDLTPAGPASDGEVEDHQFEPTPLDWGDLPEGAFLYPTTLSRDGARHLILDANNPTLGFIVDAELDGQPSINADGDDNNGTPDDEDGVTFSGPLVPGETVIITVTATPTATGVLNAWLDFDGNGSLTDSGEQIALNVTINAGETITLPINVPLTATQGITTYARFRFSADTGLTLTGLAWSGEVEDYAIPIREMDYGDAPNLNYATVYTSDGARHIILPANNPTLGSIVDAETDGAPSLLADGDDTANTDDEDGVTFDSDLVPGEVATITVSAAPTTTGILNAWIDFNVDGDWSQAIDQIVTNLTITAGSSVVITFTVPSTATQAATYARFRFSTQSDLTPTGLAPDGEIEDYIVGVRELDYGDAPDSYSTRFTNDGARHIITDTNPTLGSIVDDELDGAPSPGADGDDTANTDDEDGVLFGGDLVPGEVAVITVTAAPTATGILNAWIDFDGGGNWNQPIDQVVTNRTITAGTSAVITFTVPLTATQGVTTYARFRFSTQPDLTPTGLAPDGEVEDYVLRTLRLDYGDAPEPTYPTYRASEGPRHIILDVDNPTLGATVDDETDGVSSTGADGDDTADTDDEDGVRLDSTLIAGQVATLTITGTNVSGAFLNAWIDFDGDGMYEQVFTDTLLNAGANVLTFTVPTVVLSDTLNARFRYSTDSGLTPTGLATDGEIEDHQFEPTPLDWGDLPQAPYPTRIISDGARHVILDANNPTLGFIVDAELGGQPSINADGDDNNGDDEDGVTFSGPALIPGEVITITVTATADAAGDLNAWLDLDGNGSLTDSGEQIALNVTINAGGSVQLLVPVPVTATQGITTYARFRFSTQSDLAPTGLASDGEIEDYAISIRELEYGDLPDGPYPTYRASDGARHIFDGVTHLGSLIDTENDGQPSVNADGDDTLDSSDDEDGVTFLTPLMQGQPAQILVEAGSNGYLNAWIDFDGDGTLDTVTITAIDGLPTVSTMNDISMTTGVHTFTISVPDAPISSSVYSRFRFTSYDTNDALSYTGLATDGEVEDYVLMSLGNFVWHDNGAGSGARNDGALNGSESGIPGVELELYRYDDLATPITTTTTDAGGYYRFTGLMPYTYVVRIPASEFGSGEPLEGLLSSTGWGIPDSDLDQNVDENGVDNPIPATGGISSLSVTLSLGAEPTSEDGDANSNLTVDFGFYGGRIGDYVWLELVRDGEQGTLFETPIPGVVVDLYDSDTGERLASDTTDGAGFYLFDDLPLNVTYTVQLSQVNFIPGGPLYPYTPTIFMVGPPATPITDSDGSPDALFNGSGYAVTTTLTSVISEDLTLDFGFHAEPALELVKTVAPGAAARSMPFTYSIRIENTGQVTFTAMRLTDTLPSADFHYIGGTGDPADPDTVAEPLLVWNDLVPVAGVLPPGGSLTVSFAVTATPGITGTYWNTATVRVETTPGDVLTDTDNAPVDIHDPAVVINKETLSIDRDGVAPDYVTFTIAITNVGPSVIDVLPLVDQYDPYYLSFHDAAPYPDSVDNSAGRLVWDDLTASLGNLAPGDTLHIVTVFNIAHEINVTTTNVVTVTDVVDDYDNPANEDEDEEDIGGQEEDDDVPTAIEVLYFRAVGEEASVRLEWATAAELDIDGFSIYRAPSASFGDAQTIAYVPATGPGSEYSHIDRDVEQGQVYWYWLVEQVSVGDPDTYGPAQGGAGIDSLPYHLYLPLIQRGSGEQSAVPAPHWADWLLGRWSSLWAGLLPESRRM